MPIFEYEGKKYRVNDSDVANFSKDYPDAISLIEKDGKKYRVKSSDYSSFLKEFSGNEVVEQAKENKNAQINALNNTPAQTQSEQPKPINTQIQTKQDLETAGKPTEIADSETTMTDKDKAELFNQMNRNIYSGRLSNQAVNNRIDNLQRGGVNTLWGKESEGLEFNSKKGDFEKTYTTPYGNTYTNKKEADEETKLYNQTTADMSVSAQLRRLYDKLDALKKDEARRAKEIDEEADEYKNRFGLAGKIMGYDYNNDMQLSDREKGQLRVAIRQTEEAIKDLEEQRDREKGVDVGFWRGFGRVVGDARTWDFGMSDVRDAITMVRSNGAIGENSSPEDKKAYNAMMEAIATKQDIEGKYGENQDFWYRAGTMSGYMPAFMLDFALTGGGFESINALGKLGTKAAVKAIGEQAAKEIAEQGVKSYIKANGVKGALKAGANWTIKALGTTADDLLIRAPLMTNTAQIGKTSADIIDRKLGDVVVDDNGNYDFSNDKTWGSAIWQGEANAIIENYSEMFGAHLDPVMSLKNMSKLANVIGAKRLSGVLAKADAGALNGIMGNTQKLFEKMGVSDYVGEVTEEYYGQLWRTMLNLDDAYQQNPDGSRTNLLMTSQFHGDIWGGMALSMGMMGLGKGSINAVQYGKLKHNVNKSDRRVSALLGSDTWEQLRATLDMTTNDNIGSVAEQIIQDKDLSPQEKGAILEYMENSLILRGFNMAGFAQSRNTEQNPDEQQLNESYIDGYTSSNPEEMANIKTMFNIKQNAIANILDAETIEYLNDNPINGLVELRESGLYTQDQINTILDYLNAKQVYDGMMQSVNDNIDDKIAESNAIISARINKSTGMIQGAKHKVNDRQVYVIYGNVVPYQDGTGIDVTQSDKTIVIRDAETGKIEQISPADLSLIDEAIDPLEQQQIAADTIREQDTQEASSKIDGIITFNQGDKYLIPVAEGYFYEWTIVPNDKGLTENEDGTVNVFDGLHVYPVSKEDLQLLVNKGREIQIQESEKQRYEENKALEEQAEYPKYEMGKAIIFKDDEGNMLNGSIEDVIGNEVVLAIENPETGYWNTISYNADDLNSRLVEYDGVEYNTQAETSSNDDIEETQVEAPVETTTEDVISEQSGTEQSVSALERIPKDEQGNPIYEQAESADVAWDAIMEQTEGDETMAQTVADSMLSDKKSELQKAEKAKSKGGVTIAEKIASEKERQAAIDKAKAEVDFWQSVVDTKKRRAEELKRAEEEQKRAEEEQIKAEEEARRLAEEQRLAEERKAEENVPAQEDNTELTEEERRNKIKQIAAGFANETPEEAVAFDRQVPKMTDAELLAYMKEDGNGDVSKAHHPSVYDEYDYRHTGEVLEAHDRHLKQLTDNNTTLEQAEEMLANLFNDEDRLASNERTELFGQEEALQDYIQSLRRANKTVEEKITEAEGEVDTNPTEAQKQAGNYKKGHVKIDGYDVTIENPKGSVRSGTDASGKEWSITMNNTYGYIRGTEGVDGDHIDVFFSDNPSQGDVFVIDQVNKDGSFDEHKVMYGFSSEEEARQAYLSNYEEGWQGLGAITHVTKEEFKKWVDSSHRKTKPFAEYKNVKVEGAQNGKAGENANEPTVLRLNGEEKSVVDIENTVMEHVQRIIDEGGFDAEIVGVKVIGSYMRGEQTSESDLDVLVEYKGKAKEDVLFNAIAEEGLEINGVNVDINPITKGKSGTIEEFIKRNAGFSKVAKAEGAESMTGAFGPIYTQFKGKAKEAIDWLKSKKEGEAAGALHHHSVGDISLVWGDEKSGLAKIVYKHPEVVDNLQDIIDGMEIVQESDNRIKLESDTHFAVLSKEYKGEPREKWLLTAYEKKETSEPANSRMDVESNLEGKSDDTATRQDSDVSDSKGTNNSANNQKKDVKKDAEEKKEQKSDTATKDKTKQETPKEEDIETLIDKLGEESVKTESTGKTTPKYNEIVSKIRKIVKTLPIHYIITKKQESAHVSSIFNDELRRIDEEYRESGILSIERFRQLTTGIKEKAKKKAFKLADYIADKKSNYTVLQGIYHDPDGYAVASDAYILVAIKENVDEKTSGKIIKPDGTVYVIEKDGIETPAEYIKWKSIIRTDGWEQAVDFNKLLDFILGVKEEIKGLSKADREQFTVILKFPFMKAISFKLNQLEKFANAAIYIGANSINVKDANSSIIAKSDKGYVLLMPERLNSVSDYYDFYPERLPYGYAIQESSAENQDNIKKTTSKATDNDPLAEIEDKETYVEKNNKKGGEVKKKGEKAGNDALEDTLNNKKPTETTQTEKIEDVGEKIGGARKDMAGEYKRRAEEDLAKSTSELEEFISKTPISKIFNFDFKKLREQGMSNEVVSFIKICKQAIPAKPRNIYKLKKWVSGTLSIYEMCLKANTNWDRIKELIDNTRVGNIYQAYMAVGGFDSGLELNEAVLHQLGKEAYAYRHGEKISLEGKWRVENAGAFDGIYDTKEEAIEALKKFAGKNAIKPDTKQIKFVVYRRREDNICYITPKGKSDVIIQDGFKTATEAFDYIREHQAEMEERYRTLMSDTKVEFAENRDRKGRDYRRGKNISAQEFMEAFGFRGVEFGNWTNQEDRQKSINNAYDALMDLAEVLGVSPRALSLNGKLGMAFGARGTGKFNAHYEPDKVVINLTKTKGAGSLAHEWFHALDHYFATLGKAGSMAFATNLFNLLPERVHRRTDKQGNYKYYNYRGTELSEEEVIKAFEANGVRREMVEAWYYLMDKIRKSDYNKRSNAYSGLHKDNYWTEPTELGARAFSKWVENELSKRNAINDYLANNPALFAENVDDTVRKYKPYPFDTDAEWMEDAFGNLFQTMEQKTDEATGNVMLYQKSDGTVEKLSTEEEALRDELVGVLKQAGIEVITDNEQAQKVLDEANGDDMHQQKAPDVRFFRTTDGHAYGFTYKGKVYIDANSATAETPIHEYSHLWASAFRKSNPKEWANIVELMKGTPIWEEVKKKYPELTTDDDVADEVLAHYSGRRGAERLRAEQKKVTDSDKSILDKASAVSAIENVKQALKRFWKGVADWLNIHFTSAEDVADKVLADMLNGVNPTLNAIKEEEDAIIAKAKANGTYMKAPNGNPTNLNEKQWVQVRTKAFKNWFGDWEKAARIEKLRKSESIVRKGDEYKGRYELDSRSAENYVIKSLRGEYTNSDTGDVIKITRASRKVAHHDAENDVHLRSIAYIPEMIENAVFIEERPNEKGSKFDSYRYYVVGLKIGGVDYTAKLVVGVKNGDSYYDHSLTEIEKNSLIDLTDGVKADVSGNETANFAGKDKKLFSILQTNSSKIVDENGEPLVVYHGSGDTFTIFSPQSEWHGNFFSSERSVAESYSPTTDNVIFEERKRPFVDVKFKDGRIERQYYDLGGIYNVYLDINKPLVVDCKGKNWNDIHFKGIKTTTDHISDYALKQGYDGVIFINLIDGAHRGLESSNSFVAFNSNQVKSATENIGTFDSENPDIRYQFVGESSAYKAKDGSTMTWRSLLSEEEMQGISEKKDENGSFDPTSLRLRKLDAGETCHVERRYVENGMFDFTGKDKVESVDDVAYIFRQLENAAVENSFMVLVKDGKPTVIHLAMGAYTSTMAPFEHAFVAYSKLNPDEVYFVHNHPSGTLKASQQDQATLDRMKKVFGDDVVNPGIIIDTTSGKYGIFDGMNNIQQKMPVVQEGAVPIKVYNFSKQVFAKDWNPMNAFKIKSDDDVATFVSSHRLGEHKKMSLLVLGNDNSVVANLFLPFTRIGDLDNVREACNLMSDYIHQCGGVCGLLYGNYDYTIDENRLISNISSRMKELGTRLLDVIHVEHSAQNVGLVYEPGASDKELMDAENVSDDTMYRIREDEPPTNTGIGYKVFVLKDGKLYPPMVANPNGEATPVGVWLDADAAPIVGETKTGRSQVKAGGKGTQGGSGTLSYRPGWHLGEIPYALQFNRNDENGERTLFPANFVWAEVEYANDVDYQEEAMSYGYNQNGKFRHSYAGLPRVPVNGAYTYRTNPNPETDPWIITGAMKVNRLLTPTEVDEMVKAAGREPQRRQEGAVTDAEIEALNEEINNANRDANEDINKVNDRFNEELQQQIDGTLPKGHIYKMGMPSKILLSTGVPNLPIEMSATNLAEHARKTRHPFELKDVQGLVNALQKPIAIFSYGDKEKSQNIIVEIQRDGRNFLIGIHFNQNRRNLIVNDIRGIFPKDNAEWLNWINQGKLLYVDKAKIQALIDKQRKNLAEVEYLDLDSVAKVVQNFENPSIDEEKISPNRITLRKQMTERVKELTERLNLSNVEIVTNTSQLTGKQKRAKGFFNPKTGKITIVIPNNASIADVEQTLLHEAVAHYGLRQLFGTEFNTFLYNVFNNASEEVRRKIVALAAKNEWDFRKATEEYLASLAENTNFEEAKKQGWWQRVKQMFLELLGKSGFKGNQITDNELRYVLWRSYENLKGGGAFNGIFNQASDIAKQYELKVGEYSESDSDMMYRDGDPEVHERELARAQYEARLRTGAFQSREAFQDSMLALKEAMQAILGRKAKIEDVAGFENAYLGENRLSSVNKAEADAFAHLLFKPLLDAVAKLAPTLAERNELMDYMMAKHGLERNEVMARRKAEQEAREEYEDELKKAEKAVDNDPLDNDAIEALESVKKAIADREESLYFKYRRRDFSGLTALMGNAKTALAEEQAQELVNDFEQSKDVTELWNRVKDVTNAILSKIYESGLISKDTYEQIKAMYKYYIPLRGFDQTTSEDEYAYLNSSQSAFNSPIKTAKGRKSKADDPLAYLQSMAESAIAQGNRNKLVKQRFLNFVLNHPSNLVSISDLWLQYNQAQQEWEPVFPDNIEESDTAEEVEKKLQEFEDRMQELYEQEPDKYKRGKDAENVPYRIAEKRDKPQHQIIVKRNGRTYILTVNGNPRLAQAINGLTNPDNDYSGTIGAILQAGERINRWLSGIYTTKNPDFIISNFIRDMLYSNSMVWIKETPNYALRFNRNIGKANPFVLKQLITKYKKGTLDENKPIEKLFSQFIMNGGETGYANIRDIEQHKSDINRELKKANGKLSVPRALELLGEKLDELNRAVENCARFAAFMTSMQMGRSIERSVYDAKEISVNFNKKGSGSKFLNKTGENKIGNVASFISGAGRAGYVFWNAAVQGLNNFGKQIGNNPKKGTAGLASLFILGALTAYLGMLGSYSDDDNDDETERNAYYNLPEYVRRSNILFKAGDYWISLPLPIEYRAIYGLGELTTSVISGQEHKNGGEIAMEIAGQATQILPIDILEGGGGFEAFIPSTLKPIREAYVNKSWTGMPIYKDTPFNKNMPQWTKAYSSANKYLVGISETLNEVSGGDKYTKGAIDINPAQIEYMLNGYFGGVFSTIDKMTKMGEMAFGDREFDPRGVLLLNRVVKTGDERTEYRAINNEYFRLKEEYEKTKERLRNYERDTDNDVFDYAEKIDFIYNSPEYARYEIFELYQPDIDALLEEMKDPALTDAEIKEIQAELNEVKKEMIQEMNETRKRK